MALNNINIPDRFFIRNAYLLVAAAWLLTLSFIVDNYWSGTSTDSSVQKVIQKDIKKKQIDFNRIYGDTALLNKLTHQKYDETILEKITDKNYFIFIYKVRRPAADMPVFWNTQVIQPDSNVINYPDGSQASKLTNGWYVINKKTFTGNDNSVYKIIALIPVKWDYYVSNKYLNNTYTAINGIENQYEISLQPEKIKIGNIDGNTLFYLKKVNTDVVVHNNLAAIWLKILAAFLILLLIHAYANYLALRKGLLPGFLVLFLTIIILRTLSYFLPIPVNFRQLELFDPAIYGSNFIFPSLGDLLINSLLFFWMVLFLKYHLYEKSVVIKPLYGLKKNVTLIIIALSMVLITFLCANILRSMVSDSQISFDVLNFFKLNIYSVIGFIVICCIASGYFFLFQICSQLFNPIIKGAYPLLYGAIALWGLAFLSFKLTISFISFDFLVLLWLLLFVWLNDYDYLKLLASRIISSRFIFWIFFFSVSITVLIVLQNDQKELNNRKHFAENLSNKANPSGEMMMDIVLTDYKNDFLSDVFNRFKNKFDNKYIKDSLTNENFSGYLDKYDTRIFTFDDQENPLYNEDSTNFSTLNTILETQAKPTSTAGLYYYDVSYDRFNYIVQKKVTDSTGRIKGYVFILSNPKKYKNDALYPELFSKSNINSIESSPLYAFAVYNKNKLSISHNDYPFPTSIPPGTFLNNEYLSKKNNNYDELWYRANEDKVIVIAKQNSFFIESITLFAYLFCSFLILAAIFYLLSKIIQTNFNFKKIKLLSELNIRTQIYGTIISISIFSFLIIGITTILFFIGRYHNNNREKLSKTIQVMENEIRNSLYKFSVFDDDVQMYDIVSNEELAETINKISDIYAADINLYDLEGNLKVSSLPLPYNQGIVSTKMDPIAFYHLSRLKDVQFFKEQKIGLLTYLSNYVPVRDEDGIEYAYLNIPYFESQSKLQEEISNFLVTIINLNAFIFLIAGIIALFITNRITLSFSLISNKMRDVNIGKINEEITWKRKDEIGGLVMEYNKMVKKLDSSAERLAKSERAEAWREMARQVAHEIKNPLTPMKLNLQYLQMAIKSNSPNVKEITSKVSQLLVEQIDHLSQIASDFAQFANIGITKNQVFNLNDSLKHVSSLYSTNDGLHLILENKENEIFIQADKTQVNRLFTNLLQNAVQAVPEEKTAEIKITSIINEENKAVVAVKDNGRGIPEDMMSKIFTPNFTTKSSGTGLGLAMCKGIVEKANGSIWFETVEGEGTTFFVQLPLASEEVKN